MKNMTLAHIAEAVGGKLCEGAGLETEEIQGAVIDSRKVEKGFLFIATKGNKVDGHDFIPDVFQKGALAVVCEKAPAEGLGPYILVKDSFQALKDMAIFYRNQLDIKVVGITGSVGKTSTKEFIASTLATHYQVLKTEGNFNNEIGLPLTVLKIRDQVEIAVLEMGISEFGEMHRLSEIAKPDICVITNIGQCHLENLGTRDGILKAKSEIFDFMNPNGSVCLNGDDDKLATISEVHGKKPLFFGQNSMHAVYVTDCTNHGLAGSDATIHLEGRELHVHVPLPGEHMIYNAMAATAVASLLGLSDEEICKGIASVQPVGGRSHIIQEDNVTIIDDCYNANPVSMKAAIDLLCMADTRKVAILGDMFELGLNEAAMHEEVGSYAAYQKVDVIICVGELSKMMYAGANQVKESRSKVYYFETKEELKTRLSTVISHGDTILLKASHGMHFEELLPVLAEL